FVLALLRVGVLTGLVRLRAISLLPIAQLIEVLLGLTELLHQAAQLVFATVLEVVDEVLEILLGLLLAGLRGAHLVLFKLGLGVVHGGRRSLLPALRRRFAERRGAKRVGLFEPAGHLIHLVFEFLKLLAEFSLARPEIREIRLLLGCQVVRSFARQFG